MMATDKEGAEVSIEAKKQDLNGGDWQAAVATGEQTGSPQLSALLSQTRNGGGSSNGGSTATDVAATSAVGVDNSQDDSSSTGAKDDDDDDDDDEDKLEGMDPEKLKAFNVSLSLNRAVVVGLHV